MTLVARRTREAVTALPGLDMVVPLPEAPWLPRDAKRSARWILLHLIEEQARHAGHADIIRESLDGAVAFQFLADEQQDQQQPRQQDRRRSGDGADRHPSRDGA